MSRTLALVAALWGGALAAAPTQLTVWIPERGQTAVLSAAGLVAADGSRVLLNRSADGLPTERALPGGYTRLLPTTRTAPARLEVVQGGTVTARRDLPEAKYANELWGTRRGPCLVYNGGTSNDEMLTCFAPDLTSRWATLTADPVGTYVSASGETAYIVHTDWKLAHPYSGDVQVTRYTLRTNRQTLLTYRVPLDDKDTEYHS